jgi:REP element-mobilizing transposase RayT
MAEFQAMQFYRRHLPHTQRDATPHFVTFVTKFRWILPPPARKIVLSSCLHDHRQKYELHVAVVMPDHVHMILTPIVDEVRAEVFSLVEILRTIKSASAHKINRAMGRAGTVWMEESFDRVLRSPEKLDGRIDYILENPVRKGLASRSDEYPWAWRRTELPQH